MKSGLSIVVMMVAAATLLLSEVEMASGVPITPGDHFSILFSPPTPTGVPGSASGLFTVGAATEPGLFGVTNFTVTLNSTCSSCVVPLESSGLSFNSETGGLTGLAVGAHTGSGGSTHIDVLTLGAAWSLIDIELPSFAAQNSSGTYAVSAVPEPSTLFLLGFGFVAIGGVALRSRRKRSA
jgi:PEP-CTERM motif-containing protein